MNPNSEDKMVEVAYATPNKQVIIPVKLLDGMTAQQAIVQSGIVQQFPEIDLQTNKVGLFGKLTSLDTALRHMDRVEIYRALIADPKEVRRQRAAEGKVMRKGGGDAEVSAEET